MSTTLQCIIVFEVFSLLGSCEHGRTEGWASRVVARGANLYGADIAGIIGNMVLINSGFHKRNNLSENTPQFGHTPSELFASPILCRKSLRNIGLKERRIIIVPGGPHVFGWPWLCGVDWYLPTFRDSQTGTARPLQRGTDGLFHNSVTNYQPMSRGVPEVRRLISHVYYQILDRSHF